MEYSINEEAIWEKLSEIDKKVEKILSQSERQHQIEAVSREESPKLAKEDVENIVLKYTQGLGKFIAELSGKRNDQLESMKKILIGMYRKVEAIPPEKISLEPILQLFPKPKKVNICGFEFLRTSVIITVLIIMSFISLTMNTKQMDDNRRLRIWYVEQSELIRQLQEKQQYESTISKEQAKTKEKKN